MAVATAVPRAEEEGVQKLLLNIFPSFPVCEVAQSLWSVLPGLHNRLLLLLLLLLRLFVRVPPIITLSSQVRRRRPPSRSHRRR